MFPENPLDLLPLWGVFVFTALFGLLAFEIGYWLGKLWQKRSQSQKEGTLGSMAGATLGLLAFLLALITSMAMARHDNRRGLVVEEANAIGTAYLRAGLLDEPIASQSRALYREYTDTRLEALDANKFTAARTRSEQIHTELWSRAESVAKAAPSPSVALYIQALNDVIDLHTKRVIAALSSRVPTSIFLGLYLVAALVMVLVGEHNSYSENRNWPAIVVMIVVFSSVITLIVDLDRPQEGLLRVNQQALLDLQHWMRTAPR